MDYRALPSGDFTMTNIRVPGCLIGRPGDLVTTEISIEEGRIAGPQAIAVDMKGAIALPCFTDMHTHLDKGHIWGRSPNPDGTFMGALDTVAADRSARWNAEDVRRRMEFSLRCAYAHGTARIRTHIDSLPPQDDITWPVFAELRKAWADRIELQGVCLIGCDAFSTDGPFRHTADLVARHRGVLGMVTYPMDDLEDRLRGFFAMAAERGLDADFHVDETMDPNSETLRSIAKVAMEVGFAGQIIVGHCCSLSTQDPARSLHTLDLVAEAGIGVVSLPMCNLYLQDRQAGRTPRGRGITLVHEMVSRGIPVAFASDNTRDPFYAYGDMDMVEVMREATRIGHLDHGRRDWATAFTETPTRLCGFATGGMHRGAPADLVITRARSWTEFFARPQSDRIVLREGAPINRALPDYAELDDLMETRP